MHVKDVADYTRASLHTWIYAVFIRRPTDTVGLVILLWKQLLPVMISSDLLCLSTHPFMLLV